MCVSVLVKFISLLKQICLFLVLIQKEECKAGIIEKEKIEIKKLENFGLNEIK